MRFIAIEEDSLRTSNRQIVRAFSGFLILLPIGGRKIQSQAQCGWLPKRKLSPQSMA